MMFNIFMNKVCSISVTEHVYRIQKSVDININNGALTLSVSRLCDYQTKSDPHQLPLTVSTLS